ncbi:FHA domain-containing protein [Rheinheimera sp.]|uniref:FHA domain-containing protein n=1 Tax=Rheinheimera sp. TaxID=1869214 RepID=UPI00263921AC|nr:FHA domain-containing protein [Rheinheimera sp.]MCA1931338.1 FHA domain-containing protein [Rheinheimera sp.]
MAVIVEVLNKQQKVTERHKFAQPLVTLGRAFDNDVILFNKHVCPYHAKLTQDDEGQWWLEDLSSVNGSFVAGRKTVVAKEQLRSGELCWLGEQALRLYDDAHPVAATLPFSVVGQKLQAMGHWFFILLFALVIAADQIVEIWLTLPKQVEHLWPLRLTDIPKNLLMFCIWPAVLALWSRFNQQESHFLPQLSLTYAALASSAVWGAFCYWLGFNLDGSGLAQVIEVVGYTLILAALFSGNLWLATHWPLRAQASVAFAVALLVNSGQWAGLVMPPSPFDRSLQYDSRMLPLSFYLGKGKDMQQYEQDLQQLFEQVELQRIDTDKE